MKRNVKERGVVWFLLASLFNCPSLQYQPIELHTDGECALLLDGPGRSSAFDYQFNALRGTL
ncbi:hypothetical protein RUM44_009313 [Polyplax serrata]|uniref:Uncharacterized protein n=1 Tax=Polyplax serrata TaxID=468196 RepID=A0ABR1ASB1_POLSC